MKKLTFLLSFIFISFIFVGCAKKEVIFNAQQDQDTLVVEQYEDTEEESKDNNTEEAQQEREKFLTEVGTVYDFIKQAYYKEVSDEDLFEGALLGLFGNLGDPYSAFITKKDAKVFFENIQGEFGGLGIFIDEGIDEETGVHFIKVVSPIEGTPAYYVGLRSGDLIIAVDEKSTADMSATNAVKIMRGKPKTKVTLTIKRNKKLFKIDIIREIIKTVDLRSAKIDDDILYIRISRFTENTPKDFQKAIRTHKDNYNTMIIDLRDNPGGSLESVLQLSDYFLEKDTLILGTESRIISEQKEYTAKRDAVVPEDKKLYVMLNNGSASASEIFAGAMKDNGRGTLLGTTSFGKGLVQTVRPYKEGVVKITIAQYYTPSRIFINEVGVEPDIEIESPDFDFSTEDLNRITEIRDRNLVRLFVEEKKGNINEDSISEFQQRLSDEDLLIENRQYIKKWLFIDKNSYDNVIPAYSLETDPVLTEALDIIRNKD